MASVPNDTMDAVLDTLRREIEDVTRWLPADVDCGGVWAALDAIRAKLAPDEQRVPLSKSEVDGLLESAGYLHNDNTRADFISGIRYAEIHHGITQEK